jgi:hypothetical protein
MDNGPRVLPCSSKLLKEVQPLQLFIVEGQVLEGIDAVELAQRRYSE